MKVSPPRMYTKRKAPSELIESSRDQRRDSGRDQDANIMTERRNSGSIGVSLAQRG